MEKEQLVAILKDWVKHDSEIRVLQREISQRRKENKLLSTRLLEIMKRNQIDVFDIKDGKITYKKANVKRPISNKSLLELLTKYFDGDTDKVDDLSNFIVENREVVVKESIKLTIPKGGQTDNVSVITNGS